MEQRPDRRPQGLTSDRVRSPRPYSHDRVCLRSPWLADSRRGDEGRNRRSRRPCVILMIASADATILRIVGTCHTRHTSPLTACSFNSCSDQRTASQILVALLRNRSDFCSPPVESCRGTIPIEAAKSRPDRNTFGSGTVAAMAVAPSRPIPGMLLRRLHASSARC